MLVVALLDLTAPSPSQSQPALRLTSGMVVTRSGKVVPKVYNLPNRDESLKRPVVTIRGKGIVVDFQGATLAGSAQSLDPDKRTGLAVLVEGDDITVRNLNARGYKVALIARNCKGLKLVDCNFSYNWKQRLMSTPEKEDLADWMSFHHNEKGEWLRYGAGAYLDNCREFEVKRMRVNGGQCGLMLNRSERGLVWLSDLSFNSAIGLGMYRSSNNRIIHNKMDWCVRGYSHGVYNRGQDSAGILTFEQCSNNVFAYNSATHGGDGFFLWAGQTTMDTGKGGCNDNLLYGNDFSHSPANAIEATFSRNKFVMNKLLDCWHGVWGGYSYESVILANLFGMNGESIAIEHGQDNKITFNQFHNDTVSLYLWQNASSPDPNWGYPKHRDTTNKGTTVTTNIFRHIADTAVHLGSGTGVKVDTNAITAAKTPLRLEGTQSGTVFTNNQVFSPDPEPAFPGITYEGNIWGPGEAAPKPRITRGGNSIVENELIGDEYLAQFDVRWIVDKDIVELARKAKRERNEDAYKSLSQIAWHYIKPMTDPMYAFLPKGSLRGRKYMIVDEWGPYDFKRPILWPRHKDLFKSEREGVDGGRFSILGPKGRWRVKSKSSGVEGPSSGQVPMDITFTWPKGAKNLDIELEYTGAETTDVRGVSSPAGAKVVFGWSKTFLPIDWSVKFWSWDESRDPRTRYADFAKWMDTEPVATMNGTELSFASGGAPHTGVPENHFGTLAEGTFEVDAGTYTVNVTADDGVKVWLDGKLLLDEWHWQAPTQYSREVRLTSGRHKLEVQHFEIDGYTALKVEVKPKR